MHGSRIKGFDLLANYLWPEVHEGVTTAHAESTGVNYASSKSASSRQSISNESIASNDSKSASSFVPSSAPTEFMLFLGDFIYADVPLYFGDSKDAYRRLYRRNYQSPSFRKVYEHLRMSQLF